VDGPVRRASAVARIVAGQQVTQWRKLLKDLLVRLTAGMDRLPLSLGSPMLLPRAFTPLPQASQMSVVGAEALLQFAAELGRTGDNQPEWIDAISIGQRSVRPPASGLVEHPGPSVSQHP